MPKLTWQTASTLATNYKYKLLQKIFPHETTLDFDKLLMPSYLSPLPCINSPNYFVVCHLPFELFIMGGIHLKLGTLNADKIVIKLLTCQYIFHINVKQKKVFSWILLSFNSPFQQHVNDTILKGTNLKFNCTWIENSQWICILSKFRFIIKHPWFHLNEHGRSFFQANSSWDLCCILCV